MQFKTYNQFKDIPLSPRDWNDLVMRSNSPEVFLRYEWIDAWWQCYGEDYQLMFLTAENNNEVIGFAPLMIDAKRRARFIGDLNSDYLDFVTTGNKIAVIDGLMQTMLANRDNWIACDFRNIPQHTDLHDYLTKSRHDGTLLNFVISTTIASSLITQSQDNLGQNILSRSSLRRIENRLAKKGDIKYVVFKTLSEALQYWPLFVDQHIRRCRAANRQSRFRDPRYSLFLKSLFESDVGNNIVHFSAVFLNSKPIAFHFGLISENRLLWYKPSFEIALEKYSPGIFLIKKLIEATYDNQFEKMDFTIGPELFKNRFTNYTESIDSFRINHSNTRHAQDVAYARWRTIAKSIFEAILQLRETFRAHT